ncbi:MAG: BrxA/BrxB family bacilliredoxin [Bacteroidota bacterium]|nr:BrxA/BrxB family bacilliredoxin [Bacteroidota bacterium]
MYPEELVTPMRAELTNEGFKELKTEKEAEEALSLNSGSALVVVNSVCGCAAGCARPGVVSSLKNEKTPDHLFTVFAGQDKEATEKAREFFLPYPPSSPSIALMKDGELVHFIERHHIEGRPADLISSHLKQVYDQLL